MENASWSSQLRFQKHWEYRSAQFLMGRRPLLIFKVKAILKVFTHKYFNAFLLVVHIHIVAHPVFNAKPAYICTASSAALPWHLGLLKLWLGSYWQPPCHYCGSDSLSKPSYDREGHITILVLYNLKKLISSGQKRFFYLLFYRSN